MDGRGVGGEVGGTGLVDVGLQEGATAVAGDEVEREVALVKACGVSGGNLAGDRVPEEPPRGLSGVAHEDALDGVVIQSR